MLRVFLPVCVFFVGVSVREGFADHYNTPKDYIKRFAESNRLLRFYNDTMVRLFLYNLREMDLNCGNNLSTHKGKAMHIDLFRSCISQSRALGLPFVDFRNIQSLTVVHYRNRS